jgi:Rne/Rng family ribonuclease
MIDELLVSATPFGVRTAALAGGEVLAFNAESVGTPSLLENIYSAADGRRSGAARFVAIAKEQNAFLQKSGSGGGGNDNPLVQVTRAAWRGKAPRVSAEPSLVGRYMVYLPTGSGAKVAQRIEPAATRERLLALARRIAEDGGGVTMRSAAENAAEEAILAEAARHRGKWAEINAKRAAAAPPVLLASGPGLAERQMRDVLAPGARIVTDDAAALARLSAYATDWAPEFVDRLEHAKGALFERHDAGGALAAACAPEVPLVGGGRLIIEPTQALTAIDVDSGVRAGTRASALRATCMEAATAAAREIRLRNLAGLIVIDFPRLDAGDAGPALMAEMQGRMRADPVPHKVTDLSPSGLMEITRRRGEAPILDALTEPVDGNYGGRRRRLDALAFDIADAARLQVQAGARAVTLRVAPALAEFLNDIDGDGATGGQNHLRLGDWLRADISVRSEPERGREDWEIEAA